MIGLKKRYVALIDGVQKKFLENSLASLDVAMILLNSAYERFPSDESFRYKDAVSKLNGGLNH